MTANIADKQHQENAFFKPDVTYLAVGIDIAKQFLSVCAIDEDGQKHYKGKMSRTQLLKELANRKSVTVSFEPCSGAQYLAQHLLDEGHQVFMVGGEYVKKMVDANKHGRKNDKNDAEMLAMIALDPAHRPEVKPKPQRKQELCLLLTQRELLVKMKTMLTNASKGRYHELGVTLKKKGFNEKEILSLGHLDQIVLEGMMGIDRAVIQVFEAKIEELDCLIATNAMAFEEYSLISSIPGFGPLGAANLIARIPDIKQFKNAGHLLSYMGLTPSEYSSGGKEVLGPLSKRGDSALRKCSVTAGRALINRVISKKDAVPECPLKEFVIRTQKKWGGCLKRVPGKRVPMPLISQVACGIKLVKIVYAVLTTKKPFDWMMAGVNQRSKAVA